MARLDVDIRRLPSLAQQVARLTRRPLVALDFLRLFGARPLYIPAEGSLTLEHRIARVIGLPAAKALARDWGGQTVEVGTGQGYLREIDARALAILGLSTTAIAEELGISTRQVRRLLHDFEPADHEVCPIVETVGRIYRLRKPRAGRPARAARLDLLQRDFGFPTTAPGIRFKDQRRRRGRPEQSG